MAYIWITPKTDWTTSTHFTYTDYNRIRNNLLFLNDKINELFPDKAKTLDLGDALTGYTDNYYPSQFNAFEDALESFTRAGQNVNIGTKGVYKGNEPFIMADALNRIEKCCLKWYNYQPYITGALISPTTFNLSKNETVQLTISVVPSDAQYSVVWLSSNNTVATVNNGLVTGVKGGSVTITAIIQQNGAKDIEVTSTGVVMEGSYFETANKTFFYDFILLGKNVDDNGKATLIGRYRTKTLGGAWDNKSLPAYWSDDDANFRNIVQSFVDTNFSQNLKSALTTGTKVTMYASSGWKTKNSTQKYFCLSANEMGVSDSRLLPSANLGTVKYTWLSSKSRRAGEIPDGETDTGNSILLRQAFSKGGSWGTSMAGYDVDTGVIDMYGNQEKDAYRILFFLNTSLKVRDIPNTDGSYSIDWNGTATKTINDLPIGTIIRDDSGTGRVG